MTMLSLELEWSEEADGCGELKGIKIKPFIIQLENKFRYTFRCLYWLFKTNSLVVMFIGLK